MFYKHFKFNITQFVVYSYKGIVIIREKMFMTLKIINLNIHAYMDYKYQYMPSKNHIDVIKI